MAQCKRCQAPIRWRRGQSGESAYVALDHPGGALHRCTGPTTCRNCQKPILWQEHEGKPQCFELDGRTLHNDVCTQRDQCSHCGQRVRWMKLDGKWLAFDSVVVRELHWGLCPKNPDAAKVLLARFAALQAENETLKEALVKCQREINYREVELRRLTQKAEGSTRR